MLKIQVLLNDRVVATASTRNVTDVDGANDYYVTADEFAAPRLGVAQLHTAFPINQHVREQSAWALVARVAQRAAEDARV